MFNLDNLCTSTPIHSVGGIYHIAPSQGVWAIWVDFQRHHQAIAASLVHCNALIILLFQFPIYVPFMFQNLTIFIKLLPFSIFFPILDPSMFPTFPIVVPPLTFSIPFPILVLLTSHPAATFVPILEFSMHFPILVPPMY